jgi:hypothetical protein
VSGAPLLLPRCSIFKMFDSCMLLGSDGNVVYCGPQRLALPYMAFLGFYIPANENIADFLMDITAGEGGGGQHTHTTKHVWCGWQQACCVCLCVYLAARSTWCWQAGLYQDTAGI